MEKHTLTHKETELIKEVRNALMEGKSPTTRELMLTLGYKSPRSTGEMIKRLIVRGFLRRNEAGSLQIIENFTEDESRAQTVEIPLVGLVACGSPILAEENVEQKIPISTQFATPPHRYYLLRGQGVSHHIHGITLRA